MKNPRKSITCGSFHQSKPYPHFSQILIIRTPFMMSIDGKLVLYWNYWPEDTHPHLPPESTFQTNRATVAAGLSFINALCT